MSSKIITHEITHYGGNLWISGGRGCYGAGMAVRPVGLLVEQFSHIASEDFGDPL